MASTNVKVFISYRREDTRGLAGRVADHLNSVEEISEVFLDVNNIKGGEEFESCTDTALLQSDVCLVLIGKTWLGLGDDGTPRILTNLDFVRGEVRLALNANIKVMPVLVNGAEMPSPQDLPDDLKKLPKINAVQLDHVSFDRDIDSIIANILGDSNYRRKEEPAWRKFLTLAIQSLLGAMVAVVGLLVLGLLHYAVTGGQSLDKTLGGLAGVIALCVIVVGVGALFPVIRRRKKR